VPTKKDISVEMEKVHRVLSVSLRRAPAGYFFRARMRRTEVRPISS
jgi:hypothetical protein